MISDKKDYQNIRSDREISANLEILEIILSKSDTERFEYNKEILDSIKKEFKSWKSQLNDIPPRLAVFLEGKNHLIDTINEELKNKRSSSTKPIKESSQIYFANSSHVAPLWEKTTLNNKSDCDIVL